jgi:hypothetical protein
MAVTSLPAPARAIASTRPSPVEIEIDFTRLYRAFLSPRDFREPELTVFVNAINRESATRKIAAAVSALEFGSTPEEVAQRIYNLASGAELIDDGISEDHALRLYECGWCAGSVIAWTAQPLFLVHQPAGLIRAWARIPAGVKS